MSQNPGYPKSARWLDVERPPSDEPSLSRANGHSVIS